MARLRVAPSLVRDRCRALWLKYGAEREAEVVEAGLDDALEMLLDAAASWRPVFEDLAPALLGHLHGGDQDTDQDIEAFDELLLTLIDDGLLVHDFEPPLVGPPPLDWLRTRLGGRLPALDGTANRLQDDRLRVGARIDQACAELAKLPGTSGKDTASAIHATLLHRPPKMPTIDRRAVERAASLAPLLLRLKEALSPPFDERSLDPAFAGTALGQRASRSGRNDLGALALGHYGVSVADHVERAPIAPPSSLLSLLVDRICAAAHSETAEIFFSAEELDEATAELATPPTASKFNSCRCALDAAPKPALAGFSVCTVRLARPGSLRACARRSNVRRTHRAGKVRTRVRAE